MSDDITYQIGRLKLRIDRLYNEENEIYEQRRVAVQELVDLLAVSYPIARIADIPEVKRVVIDVETMYDSTEILARITLIVSRIADRRAYAHLAYTDRIRDQANMYLNDQYARGIREHIWIHIREEPDEDAVQ